MTRALRPVPDHHQTYRTIDVRHRANGQIGALDRLHPSDEQHVVAVGPGQQPIGKRRRMVQGLRIEAVECLQPVRGVPGVCKQAPALPQRLPIEIDEGLSQPDVFVGVREIAVFGAAQLVRRAMLVNQPRDLVGMPHEIRRELRADDEIDRLAVALAQVDQAPRRGMREDLSLRIPLKRNADELGLIPVCAQLPMQRANVVLGATMHERNLHFADNDALNTHRAWMPTLYFAGCSTARRVSEGMRDQIGIDRQAILVGICVVVGNGREVDDYRVGAADVVVGVPHVLRNVYEAAMVGGQDNSTHLAAGRRVRSGVVKHELDITLKQRVPVVVFSVEVPSLHDAGPDREHVDAVHRVGMPGPAGIEQLTDGAALIRNGRQRPHFHSVGESPDDLPVRRRHLLVATCGGKREIEETVYRRFHRYPPKPGSLHRCFLPVSSSTAKILQKLPTAR